MGLLRKLFGFGKSQNQKTQAQKSRYSEIGRLDAVCPYCDAPLEEKPGGKKKCPHCGDYIYVMARPFDDERVSVTAEQRQILSEEWSYRHMRERWQESWVAAYDEAEPALEEQFGFTPSKADIFWRVMNQMVFSSTLEGERWWLYHEALDALRYLREEGELDTVERVLRNAEPTPAVADELRKTLSARAQLAKETGDWAAIVRHLESYQDYADEWRQQCIDSVNQEPPPLSDNDMELLDEARGSV